MLVLILTLVANSLAIWFIIREQYKPEQKWRNVGLWLAISFLLVSSSLIFAQHITEKEAEIERQADLMYLQRLSVPLNDLCFAIELSENIRKSVHTWKLWIDTRLVTEHASRGLLSDFTEIEFDSNGNWQVDTSTSGAWTKIKFEADSTRSVVKFKLRDFGMSYRGSLLWRPANLAEMAKVVFYLGSDARGSEQNNLVQEHPPIKNIEIYADSYDPTNLLSTVYPEYPLKHSPAFTNFVPNQRSIGVNNVSDFRINLFDLRNRILDSLHE
jgi:hypothetical protein